jgi:AcrR family transcriptional regulator
VYTLFGSKDGLLVALGTRAFTMLAAAISELPATADPAADLAEAGVAVFRRFAIGHPSLFRIGVQQTVGPTVSASDFAQAATQAFDGLEARVARVKAAGLLGSRSVREAACQFHALCEGLAAVELLKPALDAPVNVINVEHVAKSRNIDLVAIAEAAPPQFFSSSRLAQSKCMSHSLLRSMHLPSWHWYCEFAHALVQFFSSSPAVQLLVPLQSRWLSMQVPSLHANSVALHDLALLPFFGPQAAASSASTTRT